MKTLKFAFFLTLITSMTAFKSLAVEPTKDAERTEAIKLLTMTCDKLPPVLGSFTLLLEGLIVEVPLEVSLREEWQLSKATAGALKAICAQKIDVVKATNSDLSNFFLKLKVPASGAASIGNYLVLNFSTGTDTDKPLIQTNENVNALAKMLEAASKFFVSSYAH